MNNPFKQITSEEAPPSRIKNKVMHSVMNAENLLKVLMFSASHRNSESED